MKRLWKRLGCLRGRHTWLIRDVQFTSMDFSGILNGSFTVSGISSGPVRCEWCGKVK